MCIELRRGKTVPAAIAPSLFIAALASASTLAYWAVASIEWIPLWHRRYFIGVLPMFACLTGAAVGVVAKTSGVSWQGSAVTSATALTMMIGLVFGQDMHGALSEFPSPLVHRGQGWRAAIAWVASNAEQDNEVFLDSGLIEAEHYLDPPPPIKRWKSPTADELNFLLYPVRGPYLLPRSVSPLPPSWIRPADDPLENKSWMFLITHRPATQILHELRLLELPASTEERQIKVQSFGAVSVLSAPLSYRSLPVWWQNRKLWRTGRR